MAIYTQHVPRWTHHLPFGTTSLRIPFKFPLPYILPLTDSSIQISALVLPWSYPGPKWSYCFPYLPSPIPAPTASNQSLQSTNWIVLLSSPKCLVILVLSFVCLCRPTLASSPLFCILKPNLYEWLHWTPLPISYRFSFDNTEATGGEWGQGMYFWLPPYVIDIIKLIL